MKTGMLIRDQLQDNGYLWAGKRQQWNPGTQEFYQLYMWCFICLFMLKKKPETKWKNDKIWWVQGWLLHYFLIFWNTHTSSNEGRDTDWTQKPTNSWSEYQVGWTFCLTWYWVYWILKCWANARTRYFIDGLHVISLEYTIMTMVFQINILYICTLLSDNTFQLI